MPRSVLLIESDDEFAASVTDALEKSGAAVIRATEGKKGLALAEKNAFDAILVSAELPDISGYYVCKRLKNSSSLASIPLVLISNETSQQPQKLNTRTEGFINKPCDPDSVVHELHSLMGLGGSGVAEPSSECLFETIGATLLDLGGVDDDEHYVGQAESFFEAAQLDVGNKEHLSRPVGWVTVTMSVPCVGCGAPLPVNGPAKRVYCERCRRETVLNHVGEEVRFASKNTTRWGSEYAVMRHESGPACTSCDKPLLIEHLRLSGVTTTLPCPSCSEPIHTFPAPPWIKAGFPDAVQVFGSDPENAAAASELTHESESEKPQVQAAMACPNCGVGMMIGADSDRTVACHSCKVLVFVPEALWSRLHPVRTSRRWTVTFSRESEIRERKAHKKERERLRKEAEDNLRQLEEVRDAAREKADKAMRWGFWAVAAVYASLLVTIAAGWGAFLLSATPFVEPFLILVVIVSLGALWVVSRPISISTGNDFDYMVFKTYLWIVPIFFMAWMPFAGSLFGLGVAVYLWRGRFGEARINSGGLTGSTSTYDAVDLEEGEGRPAALYFLGVGLLLRPALLPLIHSERVVTILERVGLL